MRYIILSHQSGILHKDVKPSNIFLNDYNILVLSDFGIANKTDNNTKTAFSTKWAAPEIVRRESIGNIQSEIYSIGLTIYTMITGINPFDNSGDTNKTKSNILNGKINYKIDRIDIPKELLSVVQKATATNNNNRYANALEIISDLHNIQAELGLTKTKVFPGDSKILKHISLAQNIEKYVIHSRDETQRKYKTNPKTFTQSGNSELAERKTNLLYVLLAFTGIVIVLLIGVLVL